MKYFFALLSVFVIGVRSKSVPDLFKEFKENFGKTYAGPEGEQFRFGIFSENVKKIEEHNKQLYEAGSETYEMGINRFTDMTEDERMKFTGFRSTFYNPNVVINKFKAPLNTPLPDSIDWRTKGAVNPIKDQGECGASWAFSAAGAIESLNFIKTGKLLSLSEQNLVDCATEDGCDGSTPSDAYDYITDNGIETGDVYPYTATNGTCKFNKSKSAVGVNSVTYIEDGKENLKAALALVGPVSALFDEVTDWFDYKSGIFWAETSYTVLYHAVVIVGYGSENGTDYWIVRNSWGTSWGEKGYMRLRTDGLRVISSSFPNL